MLFAVPFERSYMYSFASEEFVGSYFIARILGKYDSNDRDITYLRCSSLVRLKRTESACILISDTLLAIFVVLASKIVDC